ncbi:hypothetical protein [Domibacillus robiginosus]|uniref:hypothetical protein n=1 Tax=Domibacillus robiginosus TaxID=1071054 RepID=UPI0012E03B1F|nr:hypothetical protein [Domibacillus robiginosus]
MADTAGKAGEATTLHDPWNAKSGWLPLSVLFLKEKDFVYTLKRPFTGVFSLC